MSKIETPATDAHVSIQSILVNHAAKVRAIAETGEIDDGLAFAANIGEQLHADVEQVCTSEGGASANAFVLRAFLHGLIDQAAWLAKTAETTARQSGVELQNMNDKVTEFDAVTAAQLLQRFTNGVQQLPAALVLRDGLRRYADSVLTEKWVPREQRKKDNRTPSIEVDDAGKIGAMMASVLGSVGAAA